MAKALDAPYEAGRAGPGGSRSSGRTRSTSSVLAAEWGHGRRAGWLSNLHLGACDPESGGFVMLGKTFKGMTDQMLAWQTETLQALATATRRPRRARAAGAAWSRSPSTTSRRARTIPAGSRSASRGSRATAPTSGRRRPTPSTTVRALYERQGGGGG